MSTQNPPTATPGLRLLTPKEQALRAISTACEERKPACTQVIWVSMFFDGTNNNKKRDQEDVPDPAKRSHSNIAVLHDTFKSEASAGYFRFYIPGVGTKFPEIGEENETSDGKSLATGGEARIHHAMIQLYNAVHRAVNTDKPLISRNTAQADINDFSKLKNVWTLGSSKRKAYFDKLEIQLKSAIKNKKPEVKLINLSVFGFSRGAAEARAFTTWMLECCKSEGGGLTFCGIPIRFQFLGLFDTVASVGMADSAPGVGRGGVVEMADGLMDWADGTLDIPPEVERCVHYVAAHEIRKSFPLSSVRRGKGYPANTVEVIYPGAHSDVGGGYAPGDQGKSRGGRDKLLSQVPLVQMYLEARKSGVPLQDIETLRGESKTARTADDLQLSPDLAQHFQAYMQWAQVSPGPVEDMAFTHMRRYWQWRRQAAPHFDTLESVRSANAQDREDLKASEGDFQKDVSAIPLKAEWAAAGGREPRRTGQVMTPAEKAIHEDGRKRGEVPKAAFTFLDRYVHDSHASFYIIGPVTAQERQDTAAQVVKKQKAGKPLSPFEQRVADGQRKTPAEFPVMRDADRDDLLAMTDSAAARKISAAMAKDGRRESGGHVHQRKVFDAS